MNDHYWRFPDKLSNLHVLRNSAQGKHGFCCLLFPILHLMNWMLMLLQLLRMSVFSLQTSPTQAWSWASLMAQTAQPTQIRYHLMCASPQPRTSKVLPEQVWSGVGLERLPMDWSSLSLFSAPSTILKPITMPDIQITEVDAPAESDQVSSPTGNRCQAPPGGRSLQVEASLVKTDVVDAVNCYLSFE